MEQVDIDGNLPSEAIKETLAIMFPELRVFEWDIFISAEKPEGGQEPEGYDSTDPSHVFYATQFIAGRTEFKWKVSFFLKQGNDVEERERAIARQLSATFDLRTMVGFSHPSFPGDPYYCLVFIEGESFLAEDCEFDYQGENEPPGTIKILEPYQILLARFDVRGNTLDV